MLRVRLYNLGVSVYVCRGGGARGRGKNLVFRVQALSDPDIPYYSYTAWVNVSILKERILCVWNINV